MCVTFVCIYIRLIEEVALVNDYDLDYQSILDGSRPATSIGSVGHKPSASTSPKSRSSTRRATTSKPSSSSSRPMSVVTSMTSLLKKKEQSSSSSSSSPPPPQAELLTNPTTNGLSRVDGEEDSKRMQVYDSSIKWTEAFTADGTLYYYNNNGETVWELPEGASTQIEGSEDEWSQGGGEIGWWEGSSSDHYYGDSNYYQRSGEGGEGEGGDSDWAGYEGDWGEYNEDWGGDWGGKQYDEPYDESQWEELVDEQGFTYWYNATTGESQY
jgi:hypothetical protein